MGTEKNVDSTSSPPASATTATPSSGERFLLRKPSAKICVILGLLILGLVSGAGLLLVAILVGRPEPPSNAKPEPADLRPHLRVHPVSACTVFSGDRTFVTIKVERRGCKGPVDVQFDNLPERITIAPVTIPENGDIARVEIVAAGNAKELLDKEVEIIAGLQDLRTNVTFKVSVKKPSIRLQSIGNVVLKAGTKKTIIPIKVERQGWDGLITLAYFIEETGKYDGKGIVEVALPNILPDQDSALLELAVHVNASDSEDHFRIQASFQNQWAQVRTGKWPDGPRWNEHSLSFKLTVRAKDFIALKPIEALELSPGEIRTVPVFVERGGYNGPIKLNVSDLPENVRLDKEPSIIAANQEKIELRLFVDPAIKKTGSLVTVRASTDTDYIYDQTRFQMNVRHLAIASGDFTGHTGLFRNIAFTPDSKHLVCCTANELKIWDLASRKATTSTLQKGLHFSCMALKRNGQTIATGTSTGFSLWGIDGVHRNFSLLKAQVHFVSFSADGTTLAVTTEKAVITYNTALLPVLSEPRTPSPGYLTTSDDGTLTFAIVDGGLGKLRGPSASQEWLIQQRGIRSAAFTEDKKILAIGTDRGGVALCNIATRKILVVLSASGPLVDSLAFSPDGKMLAAGSVDMNSSGAVRIWEFDGSAPVPKRISLFQKTRSLAGTRWAGTIATVSENKKTLGPPSDLALQFIDDSKVVMTGKGEPAVGIYTRTGDQVMLVFSRERFSAESNYSGTIKGSIMSGSGTRADESWTWTVGLQELELDSVSDLPRGSKGLK